MLVAVYSDSREIVVSNLVRVTPKNFSQMKM